MSRSDVLLRHIRKCEQGSELYRRSELSATSKRSTRDKKACNRCAGSKSKCDGQTPCQRCHRRSLPCEYTRSGYADVYEAFLISKHNSHGDTSTAHFSSAPSAGDYVTSDTVSGLVTQPISTEFEGLNLHDDLMLSNLSGISDANTEAMDFTFQHLDWDALLTLPNWSTLPTQQALSAPPLETNLDTNWTPEQQFDIEQLDSTEAKCIELRRYMTKMNTGFDSTALSKYITRDGLLECIRLFAKCYQPIQPLIHLPTFQLIKTSPELLISMMLVGACYSKSSMIPPTTLIQMTIHMLLLLETTTHERTMEPPPLPFIQAYALLCQILIMTNNPQAFHFTALHKARIISMAERASLFLEEAAVDYHQMSPSTFDWKAWSISEMRKRLAYHIFVDDIGGSIFTRRSSHFLPFTFHVYMPCYQDCWAASTASQCLSRLHTLPASMQLAPVLRLIRSATPDSGYLFDASDHGMLQLVMSIHKMLFLFMEQDMNDNCVPHQASTDANSFTELLKNDIFKYDIVGIADYLVTSHGSDGMKHINNALNAWSRNWTQRKQQDVFDEDHSSFSHPLNFWYIAKLFILVHFFRNQVEFAQADDQSSWGYELGRFFKANDGSVEGRLALRVQVIRWFSMIRNPNSESPLSADLFLSQVMSTRALRIR